MRDYGFGEARVVLREMAWQSCLDLRQQALACDTVGLYVGYSGQAELFGHGGGQRGLGHQTAGEREVTDALLALYDQTVARNVPIRRVCLWLGGVVPAAIAAPARRRFGPNTVLSGTSLLPAANARERNLQIGGHRA